MEAKIIFADAAEISVEKNGDSLILEEKPEIKFDMSSVTVQSEDGERIYRNAELIECASIDGRYWFAFHELTPDELYRKQLDDERNKVLDLIAEQEYQLCLIDLGLN